MDTESMKSFLSFLSKDTDKLRDEMAKMKTEVMGAFKDIDPASRSLMMRPRLMGKSRLARDHLTLSGGIITTTPSTPRPFFVALDEFDEPKKKPATFSLERYCGRINLLAICVRDAINEYVIWQYGAKKLPAFAQSLGKQRSFASSICLSDTSQPKFKHMPIPTLFDTFRTYDFDKKLARENWAKEIWSNSVTVHRPSIIAKVNA